MADWAWDQFNPEFARRLQAMVSAAASEGRSITLTSGTRSIEQQIALRKKNGCPDIWNSPASSCRVPTAIPGRSRHNHGFAADIGGDRRWANENAHRFGLHFNVQGEDWHVEMIGDAGAQEAGRFTGEPMGFDFDWMEEQGNPQDELANRLFSIQGMLNMEDGPEGETVDALQGEGEEAPLAQDVTIMPGEGGTTRQSFIRGPGRGGMGAGGGGGDWGGGGIPPPGYNPPGKGVERWRPVALAALAYTGQDPRWVDLMLKRMNQESGGDPNAINRWDSNAARGDPSIGLMQNIGSAFNQRAQELAGRGIRDGFANMVASIRYSVGRYGDLGRAWSRKGGY